MSKDDNALLKTVLIISMITFGAANTILFKWQGYFFELGQDFNHPFMQTLTMFIGEVFCIGLYLIQKKKYPEEIEKNIEIAEQKGLSTQYRPILFLIPTTCDFVASTLNFFGLSYLPPSVAQMLRGGVIVVTALASKFFLKKQLYRHKILGIFLVILGITLVGSSAILNNKNSNDEGDNTLLGIILVLMSIILQGGLFISEEKIFESYHVEPLKVTATEGMWGIVLCCVFIPIFNFIKIDKGGICGPVACSQGGTMYVERTDVYFKQMGQSVGLCFVIFASMCTIAIFNASGVAITKYSSSLIRSILDVTRTIFIWAISLFLTKKDGSKWETFQIMQLLGFLILVLGNFVFNEIIIVKLCGMDKYVQENLNNQNALDSSTNSLKKRLTSKDDLYEAINKN